MDEFGSNLDVFSDRHADIRKSLKPLPEAIERWQGILRNLAGEPAFDLAVKRPSRAPRTGRPSDASAARADRVFQPPQR